MINETVPIMLEIPPRVNSAFTSAFFVWATKPVSTKLANCLILKCGSLIKIITVETKILINKVGIAGILHHAQTNIKMIGKLAHQLIVKCCSKILIVSLTRVISGALLACPSAKKPIKEIKKAGIVVHIIFLKIGRASCRERV